MSSRMESINFSEHDSFYQTINEVIHIVRYQPYFVGFEGVKLLSLLNKIKNLKESYGQNHPSMPRLLNHIGDILEECNLLKYSILFFVEQLQIEKYYLGFQNPDLASTLHRIGQAHLMNNQMPEAAKYLFEAFRIVKSSKEKENLYGPIIYNLGLVAYHQSLYIDAFKIFDFAIKEQRKIVGDFHPDLAAMYVKVADLQVEIGRLKDAMNNYLEALIITRMTYGSTHSMVFQILQRIGFLHKAQGEYEASLNSFYQAIDVLRKIKEEDLSMIAILHEIGLIHQFTGDVINAIKVFEEIIDILRFKLGDKHICQVSLLGGLNNLYSERGMIENSKKAMEEMQDICHQGWHDADCDEFELKVIEIIGYPMEYSPPVAGAA